MKRVLIVEDDKDIRETLQNILELVGYTVVATKNGKEAYISIIDMQPDLVLCDVDMPVMGGFELLSSINRDLDGSNIPPFIFLTAKVEKDDIAKGMNLGAVQYIIKPYEYIELIDAVTKCLRKQAS